MIKHIKLSRKNAEHLRFVRHGLNDDISNDLSGISSSCTETNMKITIFYLKGIWWLCNKGFFSILLNYVPCSSKSFVLEFIFINLME